MEEYSSRWDEKSLLSSSEACPFHHESAQSVKEVKFKEKNQQNHYLDFVTNCTIVQ